MSKFVDFAVVLFAAAVTAVAAGAVLRPAPAGADDPVAAWNEVGGVRFDVSVGGEEGGERVLTVRAVNPREEKLSCETGVVLYSTRMGDEMSRRPPMPTPVWSKDLTLTLEPGESRDFRFATGYVVPEGTFVAASVGPKSVAILEQHPGE